MKTLYEHYQSLGESYYQININVNNLFSSPNTKDRCNEFINRHFIAGRKEGVLAITKNFEDRYLSLGKQQHTVSLYLLGLLASPSFCSLIKWKLQQFFELDDWFDIKYTWFLTCLFHDVTSCVEHNSPFKYNAEDILHGKIFKQENENKGILRFSRDTYFNYLQYRKIAGSNEHGIIAGVEIFDRLYNSFKRYTAGHDWNADPVCRKGNLNWRREHIPHFAYIADAICCHNIWLAKKSDVTLCKKYKDAGLSNLIVNSEDDKLSLTQYPLQFMLCLLDTFEPIKRFEVLSPDEVLKNIYLDFHDECLTLGWTPLIKEQPQFFDWLKPIAEISDWMQVSTTPCFHEDKKCFITLSWKKEVD